MTDRMERRPSFLRLDLHYIAMQCGFWAMFGAICAYQAALLFARGFTNSETGLVISVRCLTGIVAQPLLGLFADRHPNIPLKWVMAASLLLSLAAALPLTLLPLDFLGTVFVFAVIGAFETSAYPLIDSMAIQYINDGIPLHYSLGRGIGSLAYAICCALLGVLTARFGIESVLPIHTGLIVVEILLVSTFPTHRGTTTHAEHTGTPQSPVALLKTHPRFSLSLLASLFCVTGIIPLSNFLVNMTDNLGGDSQSLGLALFLMGFFELPSAFLFPKLKRWLGTSGLFTFSLFFCAVKCAAFALAPSITFLLCAQSLQMLGYGLFAPTSVFLVNENVSPADRVQGQTLMMVASNGLGGVLGSAIIGRALDLGVTFALILCTLFCLVGGVLALFAQRLPTETVKEV